MTGFFCDFCKKLCLVALFGFTGCDWWEKPPTPAQEEVHQQATSYAKGIINFENVTAKGEPELIFNNVDISKFPNEVQLFCTVLDSFGNHIANLAPPYNVKNRKLWKSVVEVWADSSRHKITNWSVREVRDNDAPPFTSALVVDYSGSMSGDVSFLNTAVEKAVTYLRGPKDDYCIVQFDHRVFAPVTVTNNPQAISKLMSFSELGGTTAFYDGSSRGLSEISRGKKTKIAILFTDGGDNASIINLPDDIVRQARKLSAHMFVIGLGASNTEILKAIAEQTGGKAYFPNQSSELSDIFEEIYRLMKVHYVITYKAQTQGGDGRNIEVALDIAKGVTIKGNRNYYVKPKPIEAGKKNFVVLFETAQYSIPPEYAEPIKRVTDYLKNNPGQQAIIRGHTDSYDAPGYNLRLSKRRALAVRNALLKAGVSKDQIAGLKSLGETELFHKDDRTAAWKAKENRRTEIILQ